jgi:hypothetical protein
MIKRLTVVGLSVFALAGLFAAPAANAAGQVCYDIHANINGTPIDQTGCQDLPV